MTPSLLQAVVAEIAEHLTQQAVQRVACLGSWTYLLRFATAMRDNLLLSVRPDLPRLHLMPRPEPAHEAPPDAFAALLDEHLGGAVLESAGKAAGDRVVEMVYRLDGRSQDAGRRRLIVELFGRSANALLLDPAGTILGSARTFGTAGRAPDASRPSGRSRPPLDAPVPNTEAPTSAPSTATGVIWSRRPLETYREGDIVRSDEIRVEAGPPPAAPDGAGPVAEGHVTLLAGPSEAAQVAFGLIERLRDFQDRREHHLALVRREVSRLGHLESRLVADLDQARDAARFRIWGEALLAGLPRADRSGRTVRVPDPERPDGPPLIIPVDPAMSLAENAQSLFARYKKGKRGVATIEVRLAATRARLRDWTALDAQARQVETSEDLARLREGLDRLGVVHPASPRKAGPPPRVAPTRVRRHTTADGFVIMVGRSGAENDTLTFKVASPEDFWLHAAGSPGAHVVVRNPARVRLLPERTLRAAAGIAAHYSGSRGEGKVEVHYTQRKHVHKRKGMPPGQVLVRKFQSIRVAPHLPEPMAEDV
jgi:predicted ribosome quality control (RQC) complex YloA/Tae2 family protein